MTDPDPLAAIKAQQGTRSHEQLRWVDAESVWLIAEVDRLRDLLARLEWAGHLEVCPVCDRFRPTGHNPGCELAAALHPGNDEAGATPKDDADL